MSRELDQVETQGEDAGSVISPLETSVPFGGRTDSQAYETIAEQLKTYYSAGTRDAQQEDGSEDVSDDPNASKGLEGRKIIDLDSPNSTARADMLRKLRIKKLNYAIVPEESDTKAA